MEQKSTHVWVLSITLFPTKRDNDKVTYLEEVQMKELGKLFILDRHLRKEGERNIYERRAILVLALWKESLAYDRSCVPVQ